MEKESIKRPLVGLSILVLNDKKQILLSKRIKNNYTMATPGGHFERFEELEDCCQRELQEETNIMVPITDFKYLFFKNIVRKEKDYHYLDFFYVCSYPDTQVIKNPEPLNHTDWEWFDLETIFNTNLNYFYGMEAFIEEMKNPEDCYARLLEALKKR